MNNNLPITAAMNMPIKNNHTAIVFSTRKSNRQLSVRIGKPDNTDKQHIQSLTRLTCIISTTKLKIVACDLLDYQVNL